MVIQEWDKDILGDEHLKRIQEDPQVLLGKPTLRGTRISITQVLLNLAMTGSITETAKNLQEIVPTLTMEDVVAALRFAAVVCDRRLLDNPGYPNT